MAHAKQIAQSPEPMADPGLLAWRVDWVANVRHRHLAHWLTARCEAEVRLGDAWRRLNLPVHEAPYAPCTCGFYARKAVAWWWPWLFFHQVWRVELAGVVVEHEHGWRSERIRYLYQI